MVTTIQESFSLRNKTVIYKFVVTYRWSLTRSGRIERELAVFGQRLRVYNYMGKRWQNQNGGPEGGVGVGEKATEIFRSRKRKKGKEANREKKIYTVDSR